MALPPDELKNFVAPGRLSDPFHQKKGALGANERYHRSKAPSNHKTPPLNRAKVRPGTSTLPSSLKRKWPYYMSSNTEATLDRAIAQNRTTEAEVPAIMRIALAVAESFRRKAPSITDLDSAIEFRTEERIRQIASGEIIVTTSRINSTNNSGMMNPKQLKHFWSSLAAATLRRLKETPNATE